jgi:hypothetical protein
MSIQFLKKSGRKFICKQERRLLSTGALYASRFWLSSSTCFSFLTYSSGTKGWRPTFSLEASPACVLISWGIVFCSLINCDIVSNYLKGSRITSKFMKSNAKNIISQCMSKPILLWDLCTSQLSYFDDMYWCLWWLLANVKPPSILLPPRKLQPHSQCKG